MRRWDRRESEPRNPVWRAETGWAVVAGAGGAEVVAAAGGAVAALDHVEGRVGLEIGIAPGIHRAAIGSIDAAEERRRYAGAAEDEPGRASLGRPIDSNAGRGISDSGDIRHHAQRAE